MDIWPSVIKIDAHTFEIPELEALALEQAPYQFPGEMYPLVGTLVQIELGEMGSEQKKKGTQVQTDSLQHLQVPITPMGIIRRKVEFPQSDIGLLMYTTWVLTDTWTTKKLFASIFDDEALQMHDHYSPQNSNAQALLGPLLCGFFALSRLPDKCHMRPVELVCLNFDSRKIYSYDKPARSSPMQPTTPQTSSSTTSPLHPNNQHPKTVVPPVPQLIIAVPTYKPASQPVAPVSVAPQLPPTHPVTYYP
ncbi:hypothetical protein EDD22DRAFT_853096 [Suillus occidentalis]|nr:hypothetical protein EDD22DRAFT_853096 [Suillus occidentalis]